MSIIAQNLSHIREEIATVCQRFGRSSEDVTLIGVTKFASVDQIEEAVAAGLTCIAENRVQNAAEKFRQLSHPGSIQKHLIGPLQSNKVKDAVALFDMIQSVDRLKIAQEIDKRAAEAGKVMDVLVQVNTSGEEQKHGFTHEDAVVAIREMSALTNIRILGLMTMAPLTEDENLVRQAFRDLKGIFDEVGDAYQGSDMLKMQYLSMGMSQDYHIAIEEGANMVRIGSAIFAS